jgi:hypothetical protein
MSEDTAEFTGVQELQDSLGTQTAAFLGLRPVANAFGFRSFQSD